MNSFLTNNLCWEGVCPELLFFYFKASFFHVCCIHVCVYLLCVHMCTCMWKPEVSCSLLMGYLGWPMNLSQLPSAGIISGYVVMAKFFLSGCWKSRPMHRSHLLSPTVLSSKVQLLIQLFNIKCLETILKPWTTVLLHYLCGIVHVCS